jgi:hypothetical protein
MRAPLSYGDRREPRPAVQGIDPDTPKSGFYKMRLRSGGVYVGVSIWHGLPCDPETGDEMDRAPCWNARINGEWANILDVWPRCAGEPISAQDYAYLCAQQDWGRQHAPESAYADPSRRIDLLSSQTPLPF